MAVVLASLIGLVIAQYVIQIQVGQQWAEISELGEPARTLVTEIQLALGLEAAGTRGFLLTGDAHYADGYADAGRRRDAAYQKLISLTKRLGPLAYEEVLRLGRLLDADEPLLARLFKRSLTAAEYVGQLSQQQHRFVAVTQSAHRIDDLIGIEVGKRTTAIRAKHRFGVALMTVLVALALSAALVVAQLARRYRLVAQEIERVTESRAALLRGFSHDVRNPLSAAAGSVQMLDKEMAGPLTDRQRRIVERVGRSLANALRLIEDLLDLARAETIHLEKERVDVREIVKELADTTRAQAELRELTLNVEASGDLPRIETDPGRVRQILGNLISNAVKYTERGGITLRVALRKHASGRTCEVVDVVDTGPGFREDQKRLLFREFQRFDTGNRIGGAGIGLAISQRLANMLGGKISVESMPGQGSTFTLWLPLD